MNKYHLISRLLPAPRSRSFQIALAIGAIGFLPAVFAAGEIDKVAQSSGDWDQITWDAPGVPGVSATNDWVHIENGYTVTYTGANEPGSFTTLYRLYVGDDFTSPGSETGTLTITGGDLTSNNGSVNAFRVGDSTGSTGTINVEGGKLRGRGSVSGMIVGAGNSATGFLNVSSGELSLAGSLVLGGGNLGASGTMTVSGGTVTTSSGTSGTLDFFVGGRNTGDPTSGTFTQTGGTVSVDDRYAFGVGFAADSSQDITGRATITAGTLLANVVVGRDASVTSGGGTGKLTIGSAADVTGRSAAWQLSGTGEIAFQLGTTDTFNAVDLTGASALAFDITQAGAVISVDGSNLLFAPSYNPVTLMSFTSGFGPSAPDQALVSFEYNGFDPNIVPELNWTATSLELTLTAVPEPSSVALLMAGGVLVLVVARRRRQMKASTL